MAVGTLAEYDDAGLDVDPLLTHRLRPQFPDAVLSQIQRHSGISGQFMAVNEKNGKHSQEKSSATVGLYEAIDAIAAHIDLLPDWKNRIDRCASSTLPYCGFDPDHNDIHRSQATLLASSLARSYKRWNAAAELHFCRARLETTALSGGTG